VILPGGLGAILGTIAGWFSSDIVSFVWPDCAGPVAVGLHVWSGAQVQVLPLFGTGLAIVEDHPGTNALSGCGSNSDYQVSWSVTGT
jgi:hypothetical protein